MVDGSQVVGDVGQLRPQVLNFGDAISKIWLESRGCPAESPERAHRIGVGGEWR